MLSGYLIYFQTVQPTNKKYLLAIDVSGSMSWGNCNGTTITPRVASAAMAMLTARTEPQYHFVGFSHRLVPLAINSTMRMDTVLRTIEQVCGYHSMFFYHSVHLISLFNFWNHGRHSGRMYAAFTRLTHGGHMASVLDSVLTSLGMCFSSPRCMHVNGVKCAFNAGVTLQWTSILSRGGIEILF